MLAIITIIFGFIGISQVLEISDDIQFPARYGIRLSKIDSSNSNISSNQVYNLLSKSSTTDNQNIFRKYIDKNGDEIGFCFSKEKDSKYSNDIRELKDSSFQAMYYSDKQLSNKTVDTLKEMGITVTSIEIQWYLAGISFWSSGIRAIGLWGLIFSVSLAYFSILNLYKKENYVIRFLGKLRIFHIQQLLIDWFTILVISIILYFSYFFIFKHPFSSIGSLAYFSILGSNFVLFATLIGIIRFIYNLLIRHGNILTALRGKNNPLVLNTIWFIGIIGTLLLMPIILNQITQNQTILRQQVDNLKPWSQLDSYRLASINMPSFMNENNSNNQIDVSGDLEFGKKFMSYFNSDEYIFTEKSGVYIPDFLPNETKKELEQQYAEDNIDPKIMKNVIYMNTNAYFLSNKFFENKYQEINPTIPATIIIPTKYKKQIDSVINATYMEFFQHSEIKRNFFKTIVVPNDEKTFLFDYNGADLFGFDDSRVQTAENEIVVVLNMESVLSTDSAVTTYSNLMKGLFLVDGISKLAKDSEINQNINEIINPYKSIKLKINRLEMRIKSAVFSLFSLIIIQIYVINQFFLNMARQKVRTITIKRLLGKNLNLLILKSFKWYLSIIVITLIISFIFTINPQIKVWLLLLNLLEISLTLLLVKHITRKNTINVLKGDFEL